MTAELILFISAGSVFAFLLFLYGLISFESKKGKKLYMNKLYKSYGKDDLRKMEYDVAYYDRNYMWFLNGTDYNRQVTIDDILRENHEIRPDSKDKALFVRVEDAGVKAVNGHYKPGDDK